VPFLRYRVLSPTGAPCPEPLRIPSRIDLLAPGRCRTSWTLITFGWLILGHRLRFTQKAQPLRIGGACHRFGPRATLIGPLRVEMRIDAGDTTPIPPVPSKPKHDKPA